jgi:hypothetical protein
VVETAAWLQSCHKAMRERLLHLCQNNTTANWRNIHQRPKLAWCVSPCCQPSYWWFASMFLGMWCSEVKVGRAKNGTVPYMIRCSGLLWGSVGICGFCWSFDAYPCSRESYGRGWDMIDMMGPPKRGSLALVKQWALYRFGLEFPQFPQVWVSKINPRSAS